MRGEETNEGPLNVHWGYGLHRAYWVTGNHLGGRRDVETDGWKEGRAGRQTTVFGLNQRTTTSRIDRYSGHQNVFQVVGARWRWCLKGRTTTYTVSLHQPLRYVHTMEVVGRYRPILLAVMGDYISIAISWSQYPLTKCSKPLIGRITTDNDDVRVRMFHSEQGSGTSSWWYWVTVESLDVSLWTDPSSLLFP